MGIADERATQPAPTVSVVIPVKDDSAELAACLAALHAQSRPADEIIVVDNASTDNSAATADAGGARVVTCAEPGIPAASARGYDAAQGELILRLDADCMPPSSWISDVVGAFADHPEACALTGSARFTDGPLLLRSALAVIYLHAYTAVSAATLGHRPLFGSNLAMRREVWQGVRASVHRHDPNLHDDLDLSFHVGERHRVRHMRSQPMGISMRPFHSARSFRRRVDWGFRTVLVHWPRDFPPLRWARLLLRPRHHMGARRHGRASGGLHNERC